MPKLQLFSMGTLDNYSTIWPPSPGNILAASLKCLLHHHHAPANWINPQIPANTNIGRFCQQTQGHVSSIINEPATFGPTGESKDKEMLHFPKDSFFRFNALQYAFKTALKVCSFTLQKFWVFQGFFSLFCKDGCLLAGKWTPNKERRWRR